MYGLVYDASKKLKVWIPGKTDVVDDSMSWSIPKWPNRESASTRGHRSAAQNGQYSAPTKSTSGFPAAYRGACPVTTVGGVSPASRAVMPTASKVETGTAVRSRRVSGEVSARWITRRVVGVSVNV